MQSILFEEAQEQFDSLCKKACLDHEPYIINRSNHNHVVVMSLEDFNAWQETNKTMLKKINQLIKDVKRSPFTGLGKPEPLKHSLQGCLVKTHR
jgi:prevent-host-death family protein